MGSRFASTSATGSDVSQEAPRSPLEASENQLTNCAESGRSSPISSSLGDLILRRLLPHQSTHDGLGLAEDNEEGSDTDDDDQDGACQEASDQIANQPGLLSSVSRLQGRMRPSLRDGPHPHHRQARNLLVSGAVVAQLRTSMARLNVHLDVVGGRVDEVAVVPGANHAFSTSHSFAC